MYWELNLMCIAFWRQIKYNNLEYVNRNKDGNEKDEIEILIHLANMTHCSHLLII